MRIGVTEAGDAGLDLSWASRLDSVDGAVLITKSLNDMFIEKVMRNKEKLLIHATCTGHGGTVFEPNAPEYIWTMRQLRKLIDAGFDVRKIVLRVDPVIPTVEGIERFLEVVRNRPEGINRIRISVLDMYPHVRERFRRAGIEPLYGEWFTAPAQMMTAVDNAIAELNQIIIESCAEAKLKNAKNTGCVSELDIELLGLCLDKQYMTGFQRRGCNCLGCKVEILSTRQPCTHGCLYCYWKDKKK